MNLERPICSLAIQDRADKAIQDSITEEYASDSRYRSAQLASAPLIAAIIGGCRVNTSHGSLALADFAQHRINSLLVEEPESAIISPSPGWDLVDFVKSLLSVASTSDLVSDDLREDPVFFPLLSWRSTGNDRGRAAKWYTALVATEYNDGSASSSPLIVNVPHTCRKGDPPSTDLLSRRVGYVVTGKSNFIYASIPSASAPCITNGSVQVDANTIKLLLWDSPTARTDLVSILGRTDATWTIGSGVRQRPLECKPLSTKPARHGADPQIRHAQAMLGDISEKSDDIGAQLRGEVDLKAIFRALQIVLTEKSPLLEGHALVASEAAANVNPLRDWIKVTISRLRQDPRARVAVPSSVTLAGSFRADAELGGSSGMASSDLASLFRAHLQESIRELRARAHVGAKFHTVSESVIPNAVRGATDVDLIREAQAHPDDVLDDLPFITPAEVFNEGGLAAVAKHVLHHTSSAPRRLYVPLSSSNHRLERRSVDFDGCAINIRHCPAPLYSRYNAIWLSLVAEAHNSSHESAASTSAHTAEEGEFAGGLRRSVNLAVQDERKHANVESQWLCDAAVLRGSDAKAPTRHAFAAAATLLDHTPAPCDARAAVKLVWLQAQHHEIIELLSHIVHVPASGAPEPTTQKPTVESVFFANAQYPSVLLPGPKGTVNEPVRIIVCGVESKHVASCTRDILAALVESQAQGSVGVAREAGFAARGTSDVVAIGGGALIPLAILVLLLVRHARDPRSGAFACIKA